MGIIRISKDFRKLERSNKASHKRISNLEKELKLIKELVSSLKSQKVRLKVSKRETKNETNRIRSKEKIIDVITESPELSTTELERKIVNDLRITSRATFYRLVSSLKSQGLMRLNETKIETKIETKNETKSK